MATTNITTPKIIYGFIVLFGIFLLWNYFKKKNDKCNCNSKKEGMTTTTGGMLGHIKRHIHPLTRPVTRKITASFSNPTIDYYTNKINQIFR